ncbi:MAG TPA: hypothetical protein VHJ78_09550 [Actinomycetota bacterium]|nr:hypothetical protein [Actinomycetota bacterium]
MDGSGLLVVLSGTAGHYGGWGPGGWWFGPALPLLWITLVGLGIWFFARRRPQQAALDGARQLLADRYARGELTGDEYTEKLERLRRR